MMAARIRWTAAACLGLLSLCAVCGCGKTYTLNNDVEGTLKVDGIPLVGVVIDFVPQGTEALPVSTGDTDTEGHFKLKCADKDGAVIGKHKVVIHPGRPRGPRDPAPAPGTSTPVPPKTNPPVPTGYTIATSTPLEMEVTADKHLGYDFNLITKR
jgi:hypothetical protein